MWVWKRGCIKMTIEWLAGNRLRGTTAEKPALGLPSGSVGGWVELGRTTLGSAGDDIDVSSLADKRYYMVLCSDLPTGNTQWYPRLGNGSFDTSNNYATRESYNGATDGANANQPSIRWNTSITTSYTNPKFGVGYISNLATKEKLTMFHGVAQQSAGAGTSPDRAEVVSKWTNTSNVMDMFRLHNIESGSFNTGSEVVVLGWDPADTHTTNFWEELASVDLSGGAATNIDSGTITAKKYLWFQFYGDSITSANSIRVTFNGDTESNYADRSSQNGGGEDVNDPTSNMQMTISTHTTPSFINCFAINNSANEKLVMNHSVDQNTAGAGNAPVRVEGVHKWANTSSQITSINFKTSGGANLGTNTKLKVWGSD